MLFPLIPTSAINSYKRTNKSNRHPHSEFYTCHLYSEIYTCESRAFHRFHNPLSGNFSMADAPTCYYPDGSISPKDTPCHSPSLGGGASACCNAFDVCLDNNLCLAQGGSELITRGSCTDRTWQSLECSQYCADGKHVFFATTKFRIFN